MSLDLCHAFFQLAAALVVVHQLVSPVDGGASCPNNLIEETIFKVFELRGIPRAALAAI